MLHAPLTTLHVVSLILQRFAEQPELRSQLLAGSGIGAADLDNADARITWVQELQVCANALALRADLGLDLGRSLHVSSYGLLGYAALSAATFGDAWRLLLQYPALLGTYFRLDMQVEGELAWICASGYRDAEALEVFNVEMCLASLRLIGDELLRQPLSLEGAEFTYAQPRYVKRYAQSFPCPLRFSAQRNAFAFPAALLERRLPLADSVTHGDMVERCRRLNAEFSSRQAWLERVRQLLAAHPAPSPAGTGHQLPGPARRAALRARQGAAQRGAMAGVSHRRGARLQRDGQFSPCFPTLERRAAESLSCLRRAMAFAAEAAPTRAVTHPQWERLQPR